MRPSGTARAASTIHFFTGNNIGPCGDLASRCLNIRLAVDRPDPENRHFEHPDPIGWTDTHRADILRALYTLLLGNPVFAKRYGGKAKTRFKTWWRLIGAAVEHGASIGVSLEHAGRMGTTAVAFHDPLVLFAFLACCTRKIGFATGVLILAQRQAALVAKQAASLDELSGGRFRLGIGVGWNKIEFEGLDQPDPKSVTELFGHPPRALMRELKW